MYAFNKTRISQITWQIQSKPLANYTGHQGYTCRFPNTEQERYSSWADEYLVDFLCGLSVEKLAAFSSQPEFDAFHLREWHFGGHWEQLWIDRNPLGTEQDVSCPPKLSDATKLDFMLDELDEKYSKDHWLAFLTDGNVPFATLWTAITNDVRRSHSILREDFIKYFEELAVAEYESIREERRHMRAIETAEHERDILRESNYAIN